MNLFSMFLADFQKGGIVMWFIFLAATVAWMIGVEKLVSLINISFQKKIPAIAYYRFEIVTARS